MFVDINEAPKLYWHFAEIGAFVVITGSGHQRKNLSFILLIFKYNSNMRHWEAAPSISHNCASPHELPYVPYTHLNRKSSGEICEEC